MEIMKLREELQSALTERQQLEEEIKARREEVYQVNEKMILMEFSAKAPEPQSGARY